MQHVRADMRKTPQTVRREMRCMLRACNAHVPSLLPTPCTPLAAARSEGPGGAATAAERRRRGSDGSGYGMAEKEEKAANWRL